MSHITDANKWRRIPEGTSLLENFNVITSQEINVLNVQYIIAINM